MECIPLLRGEWPRSSGSAVILECQPGYVDQLLEQMKREKPFV